MQDCVAVVSHRKVFREFTQLRLVQRWQAHSGVIWRLAFSATGAHLASAGRDRVIRIWENRRAPVDTSAPRVACHASRVGRHHIEPCESCGLVETALRQQGSKAINQTLLPARMWPTRCSCMQQEEQPPRGGMRWSQSRSRRLL